MLDQETVSVATAWIEPLAQELKRLDDEHVASQIKRIPHTSNWASSLGHPCDLFLTLERTHWREKALHDVRLQRIFNEGKKQETLILQELEAMGLTIYERGVALRGDPLFQSLNIGGEMDAVVNCAAIARWLPAGINWERKRVALECKSLAPWSWEKLVDYDAIMTDKRIYVRRWAEQIQLYLLGHSDEAGLFVMKNKTTGELRYMPVILDLDTCEMLCQKAKRVNEAVARWERARNDDDLPAPLAEWREDTCRECPYLHRCPIARQLPQVDVITDAEIIELLDERARLKTGRDEYNEVDEEIGKRLEAYEGKPVVAGGWQITWRKVERAEKVHPAATFWAKRIVKLPGAVDVR